MTLHLISGIFGWNVQRQHRFFEKGMTTLILVKWGTL
jgi:hypothetical protein